MATKMLRTPVIGLIENMAAYVCADCGKVENLFPPGHTEEMAQAFSIPLLGKIPFDPRIAGCGDDGAIFVEAYGDAPAGQSFMEIADTIQTFFQS